MSTDVATVLQRLILASECVLGMRDPGDTSQLVEDVTKWLERPADRERVVHTYTLLAVQALQCAAKTRRSGQTDEHAPYYRIVGQLLPDIRRDCWKAFEQRNRPTP